MNYPYYGNILARYALSVFQEETGREYIPVASPPRYKYISAMRSSLPRASMTLHEYKKKIEIILQVLHF